MVQTALIRDQRLKEKERVIIVASLTPDFREQEDSNDGIKSTSNIETEVLIQSTRLVRDSNLFY